MAATGKQQAVATPEEVWSILREVSRSQKETDRKMQETDRRMQETDRELKETGRLIKEIGLQMQKSDNRFNTRWGQLVESLVEGKLVRLLKERQIDVSQTACRVTKNWKRPKGWIQQKEFDIIVANGTEVVVVEVKTTLSVKDIREFIDTLKVFRSYFKEYRSKKVYGATAYLRSQKNALNLAQKEGLFVIRATGDSAGIVNPENFKPKAF